MKIINRTGKAIIVFMQAISGFDERKETLKPGELSDDWLHLELDNVIEIRSPKCEEKTEMDLKCRLKDWIERLSNS